MNGQEAVPESGLTKAAVADLKRHGLRLTPQRLMILELLERASGHIAPEDLYQQVHQRYPMINRSTVHRTLDVLEGLGMVRHGHVADGAARYHLARDVHHLHLICHRCGQTIEVDDLGVADRFAALLLERFGFRADLTHFPISGACAACAKDAPSASR
ncbi:MAG: Fur family transcriptional regulator [Chloroflexota bacterium]